jgi:hypothetical protein
MGFSFLAANNVLLFLDVVIHEPDFRLWRLLTALAGLGLLIYGFVREAE